jgi:hypothetical protein
MKPAVRRLLLIAAGTAAVLSGWLYRLAGTWEAHYDQLWGRDYSHDRKPVNDTVSRWWR